MEEHQLDVPWMRYAWYIEKFGMMTFTGSRLVSSIMAMARNRKSDMMTEQDREIVNVEPINSDKDCADHNVAWIWFAVDSFSR